ncbi:helix-turn-helix domain-containing protein [Halorubrum ezzemoulense]|uniref:helix-turn-helix domain-containing protein n=1 Tax=Halorubrum ezzemoulense TaxID=337243 RepID=UPI00232B729E|nr:helix-turn-helix domain-containing protein [Halorubrum ezzemoulense]MDB9235766.1 hypothetical protein [Halorubrum ezzemoulense]
MERARNDRGRYADGIDPETVMDVFDARDDAARPVTATDVVEELGIARRTAHNKLNALVERGTIDTRKIGARGRVWWIPDRRETGATDARADAVDAATDGPADTSADAHGADGAGEADALDTARERIEELDLAGSGADYDRRRDAVLKMYEHLRERPGERVSKSDFADLLDGTDVGYGGGFASLWANWVKGSGDRPNALDTLPGVELRGDDYVFEVDS